MLAMLARIVVYLLGCIVVVAAAANIDGLAQQEEPLNTADWFLAGISGGSIVLVMLLFLPIPWDKLSK